jgi:hypothetical protein
MRPNLRKLARILLHEAWGQEAGDFTPPLAAEENLNGIADALWLRELQLEVTELPLDDFKSDIFCEDGDGKGIIPNQLERTNHSRLGQILGDFARGLVKMVIWVAEAFRPERASSIPSIIVHTTEILVFFEVAVELWSTGKSPLAPKSEVMGKANDSRQSSLEDVRISSATPTTTDRQLKFGATFIASLKSAALQIRHQKTRPQHWINIGECLRGSSMAARSLATL